MAFDRDSIRQLVLDTVRDPGFRRGTFGGTVRNAAPSPWERVALRAVELRGQPHVQFSYFDGKKDFAKNFTIDEAGPPLCELLDIGFAGIHLETGTEVIDIRTSKKGKVFVGRKKARASEAVPMGHDRVKDVPLPEGRASWLLEAMGIATADGRVRPTMRGKYTQINEFLKHFRHVFDDAGLRELDRPLEILDCGCGSSYLTLAAHHYLNDVLGIPARILGVDANPDAIRKSLERAEQIGAAGLNFTCAKIGELAAKPDIVFALHACDTATDEALAQAIASEAKLILSVPCCHHHLNDQVRAEGPAEVLRPLLRHGILHERTADIVTDAFRALILRIMGYRTDVVEFVSPEHTSRNLMIRAVRGLPPYDPAFVEEYDELKRFWSVTPFLERLIPELDRTSVPAMGTAP
jgi:SAM-dependent methyltransferase